MLCRETACRRLRSISSGEASTAVVPDRPRLAEPPAPAPRRTGIERGRRGSSPARGRVRPPGVAADAGSRPGSALPSFERVACDLERVVAARRSGSAQRGALSRVTEPSRALSSVRVAWAASKSARLTRLVGALEHVLAARAWPSNRVVQQLSESGGRPVGLPVGGRIPCRRASCERAEARLRGGEEPPTLLAAGSSRIRRPSPSRR